MLKLQKEKRLTVREQFELENLDASLDASTQDFDSTDFFGADGFNYGFDKRGMADDLHNLQEFIRKNRLSKLPGSKYGLYGNKKTPSTSFGTTKRFAPEPGSVDSTS